MDPLKERKRLPRSTRYTPFCRCKNSEVLSFSSVFLFFFLERERDGAPRGPPFLFSFPFFVFARIAFFRGEASKESGKNEYVLKTLPNHGLFLAGRLVFHDRRCAVGAVLGTAEIEADRTVLVNMRRGDALQVLLRAGAFVLASLGHALGRVYLRVRPDFGRTISFKSNSDLTQI